MKLLLVEDDPQLGESLHGVLLAHQFASTRVRSAEDAQRFVDSEPSDIALLRAPKTPMLLRAAGLPAMNVVFSDGQLAGDPYRSLQVTSRDGDSTLVMAESLAARRAVIWPLLASLALKQFVALLLCLGALWWATRSMLRPLAQLTMQMTQRQPGTLTPFDVWAPDPEVALLVNIGSVYLNGSTAFPAICRQAVVWV
jgi:hypothetical protein